MTRRLARAAAAAGVLIAASAMSIGWRFEQDIRSANARSAQGSRLIATRCGPIEVQQAGAGVPLLVVHGSGGGHDQGMAFPGALAQNGTNVIAMSCFGHPRTPMPADASAAAQADAHVCCAMPWASAGPPSWAAQLAHHRRCKWRSANTDGGKGRYWALDRSQFSNKPICTGDPR